MTRPIPRIIALTTCLLMGIFAAQAFADDYNHINSLARKIHNKSKVLLKETKHYRSTPNYIRMVREVTELDQLACHLRDIAKNEGDLDLLAYDIAEIKVRFRHIVNLFDTTELCATQYGQGFIKGHTAHVKRLLNSIEDAIAHICQDIEHLRAATPILAQPAVVAYPYDRNASRPIVTRVETYEVPKRSVYRAPYGNASPYEGSNYGGSKRGSQLNHGHTGHYDRGYHAPEAHLGRGQGFGFSIGSGSTRITIQF